MLDGVQDKISQQENEQEKSGRDSNDGEKNSQCNYLNNQKDTTDRNIVESEKRESSQLDKVDTQTKDNKEEGDVPNKEEISSGLENGVSWYQDVQHDNILEQELLEISLASPTQVKLTFLEENAPIWGNEEDVKKALRKSGTKQEEEEISEDKRKGKNEKKQ